MVLSIAMTEPADQELIDLLLERDGRWTEVELHDGHRLRVLNIAWGYDEGDEYAHVTTNCSPSPGRRVPMDFFFTSDVARVIDPERAMSCTSDRVRKATTSNSWRSRSRLQIGKNANAGGHLAFVARIRAGGPQEVLRSALSPLLPAHLPTKAMRRCRSKNWRG